jgi:hypothetical protein
MAQLIVTFVTSYIPFFGAFLAGAFAVLIALGAKRLSVALAMLAITLLASNSLQNLLEPVASAGPTAAPAGRPAGDDRRHPPVRAAGGDPGGASHGRDPANNRAAQ